MNKINLQLFLSLLITFIIVTIVGTISHEYGHYLIAKYLGYSARVSYSSTSWTPINQNEIVNARDNFYITLGGPFQTMLTGAIGFVIMIVSRKKYFNAHKLNMYQWTVIFISLFWLRQTANFVIWIGGYIFSGKYLIRGDELRIANYLRLPQWSIITITALIGLIILILVVFKFIPLKQRVAFSAAGLLGGVSGYILWMEVLGPFLMPL